jgi:outer membrane protein OmpA-like peptidoglycan-associated protein
MTMALHSKVAGRFACALIFGGLIWTATGIPAAAQQVPADQIIKALAPPAPPVTRSLTGPAEPAVSPADQAFINSLRHRTRSLTVDESEHVAEIAKDRPKIDLEIYFGYNSAAITRKAEPQLNQLGEALRDPRLGNTVVVLSGHTDAKGSQEYNQKLSQRRAEAVKKYLVENLKIPADNLTTAGYGKRDLKDPAHPFAAENRRVQIVNLGPANEANR